jgi:hypothetical protein
MTVTGKSHMSAASDVFRGTYDKGIQFRRDTKLAHTRWVDADWAGHTGTRRSHTGFVLMFNGGPISSTVEMTPTRLRGPLHVRG